MCLLPQGQPKPSRFSELPSLPFSMLLDQKNMEKDGIERNRSHYTFPPLINTTLPGVFKSMRFSTLEEQVTYHSQSHAVMLNRYL